MAPTQSLKAQQSEATRAGLIATARRLFAMRGYAGVSIEEIVRSAGVTRGALYHHFTDKAELFRAVVEELELEITSRVAARAQREPRPEKHLEVGMQELLDAFLDRAVQQIVILDGPSVLGFEDWREMDAQHAIGLLRMALEAAMDADYIERQPIDPLAHMLLGAMNEAGLYIARAQDERAARAEVGRSLARIVEGLRS